MSTINESLRKLEERGALGHAPLPAGVVAPTGPPSTVPGRRRQTAIVVALVVAAAGLGWSQWQKGSLAPLASAVSTASASQAVPAPVPLQVPVQGSVPGPASAAPGSAAGEQARPVPLHLAMTDEVDARRRDQVKGKAPSAFSPPISGHTKGGMRWGAADSGGADKHQAEVKAEAQQAPSAAIVPSESTAKTSAASVLANKTLAANVKQTTPQQKADSLYQRSLQLLQESRGSDARQALEEALELNPAQHNARQLLAALRVEDRQLGRAETLLTDGLAYQPPAAALVALARLKVERGEDTAALRLLNEHLETGANDGDFQALIAALMMRQGQSVQAAEHYRNAIARQPAQGTWWAGLGLALASQPDRRAEAIQALKQARQSGKLTAALADRVDAQLLTLLRSEDRP